MLISSVEEQGLNAQVLCHEDVALISFKPQISPVWCRHGVSVREKRGFLQCSSFHGVERLSLLDESGSVSPAESGL